MYGEKQPWSADLLDYLAVYLATTRTTEEADGAHATSATKSRRCHWEKELTGDDFVFAAGTEALTASSSSTASGKSPHARREARQQMTASCRLRENDTTNASMCGVW